MFKIFLQFLVVFHDSASDCTTVTLETHNSYVITSKGIEYSLDWQPIFPNQCRQRVLNSVVVGQLLDFVCED